MTPQQLEQQEQKRALMGLLGHTYAQMKEIDMHIASAGSNAKFAGRSEDIKRQFEQVATQAVVPIAPQQTSIELGEVLPAPRIVAPPAPVVEPQYIMHAPVAVQPVAAQPAEEKQLEFNFKAVEKNVLTDIYNVLYDIRKMMLEFKEKEAKKEKKSKIANCIICGSLAQMSKKDNKFTINCTSCFAETKSDSNKECIKEWNDANK